MQEIKRLEAELNSVDRELEEAENEYEEVSLSIKKSKVSQLVFINLDYSW